MSVYIELRGLAKDKDVIINNLANDCRAHVIGRPMLWITRARMVMLK